MELSHSWEKRIDFEYFSDSKPVRWKKTLSRNFRMNIYVINSVILISF